MRQIVATQPRERQSLVYPAWPISWLPMTWGWSWRSVHYIVHVKFPEYLEFNMRRVKLLPSHRIIIIVVDILQFATIPPPRNKWYHLLCGLLLMFYSLLRHWFKHEQKMLKIMITITSLGRYHHFLPRSCSITFLLFGRIMYILFSYTCSMCYHIVALQ